MAELENPTPGWLATLSGHPFDLSLWERSLKAPFDPWVERIFNSGSELYVLRSRSFEPLVEPREVLARATALIEQLNGALSVMIGAEPVTLEHVLRRDADGKMHYHLFPEPAVFRIRTGFATLTATGVDGKPVPSPPPQPSTVQMWIAASDGNDDIADVLIFSSRADNWYDVYKAYELAQKLAGGKRRLARLLGSSAKDCENMRRTANFYRHARADRPRHLTTLEEARPLIALVVKAVLDHVLP